MNRILFVFLFFTLSSNFLFGDKSLSVYHQLVQLNKYWDCFEVGDPILNEIKSFDDWEDLIQLHLQLVEKHLRLKKVGHLSIEQQQKRLQGLDILNTYWQRKQFPQNTHHSGQIIPYFIDDNNTACAVGHVLRETGGGELAERIQQEQNYAFLEDMKYEELLVWADEFGFEEMELRWVQPSYSAPCFPQTPLPYEDDFESYTLNNLGNQSVCWIPWSGNNVPSEDAVISRQDPSFNNQSLKIQNGDDLVLQLGDRTNGKYQIKFNLFIPSGKRAYYNILHQFIPDNADNEEHAYQVFFENGGNGRLNFINNSNESFNYPSDEWFSVVQDIDINNDQVTLYIDNSKVHEWRFTSSDFSTANGSIKLAGLDFFGETSAYEFFVDDVGIYDIDLPSCSGNVLNKIGYKI